MFKAHKEYVNFQITQSSRLMIKSTEKASGMFGTLVICLPSQHTGGTVCLQHGTKKERFDTSEFSAFDATCIAWFVFSASISTVLGL